MSFKKKKMQASKREEIATTSSAVKNEDVIGAGAFFKFVYFIVLDFNKISQYFKSCVSKRLHSSVERFVG